MLKLLTFHLLLCVALQAQRQARTAEVVLEEAAATLLSRGAEAAGKGDFVSARNAWDAVLPRLEPGPREKLTPLLAHARLQAGEPAGAVTLAREWLGSAGREDPRRALVEAVLVEALGRTGEVSGALEALRSLEALKPMPIEAKELRFRVVSWLAESGRTMDALAELEPLLASPAQGLHGVRARARRIALAAADADLEPAQLVEVVRATLDSAPFSAEQFPEPFRDAALLEGCRALSGALDRLELADPALALRLARSLPTPAQVADRMRACAAHLLTHATDARAKGAPEESLRRETGKRALVEAAFSEALPNPEAHLRLRQARLLLRLNRPREAWLVAESLAFTEAFPTEVKDAAFHAWVSSALALGRWEESLVIVRAHEERFPASPHLDEMLALAAHAQLGAKRWDDAVACLDRILARTTSPQLLARAHLMRGNALLRAKRHEEAAEAFEWLRRNGPDVVWQGRGRHLGLVVLALMRRQDEVLKRCEQYEREGVKVAAEPTLEHRRILALRALGRAEETEKAAVQWIEAHAGAVQTDELLLLAGCLAVERGDLQAAGKHFDRLAPTALGPRAHAAFQVGRLLRAREDWEGVLRHFEAYARNADANLPSLSEALHWQAVALENLKRSEAASRIWTEALERFGDDPAAACMDAILAGCLKEHRGSQAQRTWLEEARQHALKANRLTLYARLTLTLASLEMRAGKRSLANALAEQVAVAVPDERLDPAGLLAAALADEGLQPEVAARRLDRLLTRHPKSMEALEANVARARLHLAAGWTHEARELLRSAAASEGHPRVALARMELAELLVRETAWDEAVAPARSVLATKTARGRLHARALAVLAACESGAGRTEAALALHQRLFTMHRSQPDLAGAAYLEAARILGQTGRAEEARSTLAELSRLEAPGFASFAESARLELARSQPPGPQS